MMVMVAVVAGALLAVGCGDDGNAEATPTPSKAVFIRQTDQICLEDGKRTVKELGAYEKENDGAQFSDATSAVVVPALEARIDKIRSLGVPRGDQQQVEAYLSAMEAGVASLNERPAANFDDLEARFQSALRLARAYGFKTCG